MDKKNIILLILILVFGALMMLLGVFFLFGKSEPAETPVVEVTEPTVTSPFDDLTIPNDDVKDQLTEIEKTGFDSQTKYWIEKLKEVTDVEADLNKGLTLDYLCEQYFYEEYKAYKNTSLLGVDDNEEYPEENVEELYQSLIKKAEEWDFRGIISEIEDLLNDYKFTKPYNYKICNIYSDAVAINSFAKMSSKAKVECIGKLKTPELVLIAAANVGYKEQCAMYANQNSLCMTPNTKINIQSVENFKITPNPNDVDGRLMQLYYGNNNSDLDVVKITFTVNFDLSGFEPSDFEEYFKTSEMVEVVDESICIFDENGNVLHYLGKYSDAELEDMKTNSPEYEDIINQEIERRKNTQNENSNQPSETMPDENISEDFTGMGDAVVEDNINYNLEAFEKYKTTVYEVYISKYRLHDSDYNRIYTINQLTNLDLPCCHNVYYYKKVYMYNSSFNKFIYENQLSWNACNDDLANEILGNQAG